jgi:hypothetical protein
MWKFKSASDAGCPHLTSLNDNKGRQTWEFDPTAGTPEQRARVEELRAAFTANRHKQKSSADELLRLQVADKIAAKKHRPPSTELKSGEVPSAERVEQHLLGAISFYECLQQDDGHFPGTMEQLYRLLLLADTPGGASVTHNSSSCGATPAAEHLQTACSGVQTTVICHCTAKHYHLGPRHAADTRSDPTGRGPPVAHCWLCMLTQASAATRPESNTLRTMVWC